MSVPWSMHVEANLLNRISNVRPSKGEVLKSTGEAAKIRGLRTLKRMAGGGRHLGICVHWRSTRFAGSHACAIQNVQHILSLI
jgi:hypothetical protein